MARKSPRFEVNAMAISEIARSSSLKSTPASTLQLHDIVAQPKSVPVPPKIGDQFRFWCARTDDEFGKTREEAWWMVTATDVVCCSPSVYKVTALHQDKTQDEFVFPHEEAQKLKIAPDSSTLLYAFVPTELGMTKEVAFDSNPELLGLGDLVHCYYQDFA